MTLYIPEVSIYEIRFMHFLDTSNSVSICTGLKTNIPGAFTQGTVYLYYLVLNSGKTALTTHNYSMLGANNFRCVGVHHNTSLFYTLVEYLTFIYIY